MPHVGPKAAGCGEVQDSQLGMAFMAFSDERSYVYFSEVAGESIVLVIGDALIPEDQDKMLKECGANILDRAFIERGPKIDSANLSANGWRYRNYA
jgi:hypothetical protein